MERPYLLFLGDVGDQLAAKTAHGILQWRPEACLGQLRLEVAPPTSASPTWVSPRRPPAARAP
jgi:hypothetical protein